MSSEKIIRSQARASLKGNLVTLIAALGLCCAVAAAVEAAVYTVLMCLGVFDLETGELKESMQLVYTLGNVAAFAVCALLSPLLNGLIKTAFGAAKNGKAEIGDMLYFFGGAARYLKTLVINLSLSMLIIIPGFALDLTYIFQVFGIVSAETAFDSVLNAFLYLFSVAFGTAVKLALYFIFMHYPLFAYSIGESESITHCIVGMLPFSIRHHGAVLKLFFSFTGWILLCFFVVPVIYVLPYMLVAMTDSVRWLIHDDRIKGIV
ncbi:MAG: hypothetical protein IIZ36_00095 [Ruminococcus sp.]|nr:hypothetical protein [Ruminococcus sp.]